MGHAMSHIGVTETASGVRVEYACPTHGLHLNSVGKMRFVHLIAGSACGWWSCAKYEK